MIVGRVNSDGVPLLTLPVAGQSWAAIVDTCFNGDLELPQSLRATDVYEPRALLRAFSPVSI